MARRRSHCVPLKRRDFLRYGALSVLAAPFVSMVSSKPAIAAPGAAKYLCIFFTNGTDPALWTPSGSTETNLVFSEMTAPLAAMQEELVIIDRLDSMGSAGSHGAPGALTGYGYGQPIHISVEQFISDALGNNGVATQIPNLLLGGVTNEQPSTFWRDGQVLSPIASPTSAYQVVFSNFVAPADPGQSVDEAIAERLRRRRSILDLVGGEIQSLSQTLGQTERQKLDIHLDSIRQLEERLTRSQEATPDNPSFDCSAVTDPGEGSEDLLNSVLHLDLAISAFACDITRVAAIQFGHHQSTQVSAPVSVPGDWHNTFLHSDNPRTRLVELEAWLSQQFVDAAEKLKAIPAADGSGTLFDQTMFVWARDMGDAVVHDGSNMRFIFTGGAGGYLEKAAGGRYLDGGGSHHQRALLNMCEAMGVTDYSGFGDPNASGDARTPLGILGS